MTIGIGLVCNRGKNILLLADMRGTYEDMQTNDLTGKLFELPHNFCCSVAGTLGQCEEVVSELYHRMDRPQPPKPSQMRSFINDSFSQIYFERTDTALRSDPGITRDEFLHDNSLAASVRKRAERVLKSLEINVSMIVAGFNGEQPVQFVATGGTKLEIEPEITPGVAVIGSGAFQALEWMNYRRQCYDTGLARSLLHLTEAKQFVETNPTIGPLRQMILLWPGGHKGLEGGQKLLQQWWNRYGLLSSEGLERWEHQAELYEVFGIPNPWTISS